MQNQLRKLQQLTRMAMDVEMIKLRQISQSEQALADQIKALDTLSHLRAEQLANAGGADVALYAGADIRWANWKQRRTITMNTQRAQLLAKREEQRSEALKAFGKNQAVQKLVEKAEETAKRKQRRP